VRIVSKAEPKTGTLVGGGSGSTNTATVVVVVVVVAAVVVVVGAVVVCAVVVCAAVAIVGANTVVVGVEATAVDSATTSELAASAVCEILGGVMVSKGSVVEVMLGFCEAATSTPAPTELVSVVVIAASAVSTAESDDEI